MSKLRRLRETAGMSRSKLSLASGISESSIVYLELNDGTPNLDHGLKLASALAEKLGRSREEVLDELVCVAA